jgi:hypothetical protein
MRHVEMIIRAIDPQVLLETTEILLIERPALVGNRVDLGGLVDGLHKAGNQLVTEPGVLMEALGSGGIAEANADRQ